MLCLQNNTTLAGESAGALYIYAYMAIDVLMH